MFVWVRLCILLVTVDVVASSIPQQQSGSESSYNGLNHGRWKRGIQSWMKAVKAAFVTRMMRGNFQRRKILLKDAEKIKVEGNTFTWLKPGGRTQYSNDMDMIANLYKEISRNGDDITVRFKSINDRGDMIEDIVIYSKKDVK